MSAPVVSLQNCGHMLSCACATISRVKGLVYKECLMCMHVGGKKCGPLCTRARNETGTGS